MANKTKQNKWVMGNLSKFFLQKSKFCSDKIINGLFHLVFIFRLYFINYNNQMIIIKLYSKKKEEEENYGITIIIII